MTPRKPPKPPTPPPLPWAHDPMQVLLRCGETQHGSGGWTPPCPNHVARWPGDHSPLWACWWHLGGPTRARIQAERELPPGNRRPLPEDLRARARAVGPVACSCGLGGHGRAFRTDPPPRVPPPANPVYGPNPTQPKPEPKGSSWNTTHGSKPPSTAWL